jgi:hypothetical protein
MGLVLWRFRVLADPGRPSARMAGYELSLVKRGAIACISSQWSWAEIIMHMEFLVRAKVWWLHEVTFCGRLHLHRRQGRDVGAAQATFTAGCQVPTLTYSCPSTSRRCPCTTSLSIRNTPWSDKDEASGIVVLLCIRSFASWSATTPKTPASGKRCMADT